MEDQLDILACGAHPDDIEIGMGATIAAYIKKGWKCGFLTLTKAELSSNGTVDIRQLEAANAAELLGVSSRYQLSLPDRGLKPIDQDGLKEIVRIIRQTKPTLIFIPESDRHPDHGECATIMKEAIFNAGIRRYGDQEFVHKTDAVYRYFINGFAAPDFVVDVGHVYEKKQQALQAYGSQFAPVDGVRTPLTDEYIASVQARDRLFGKEVGVKYAEGFKTEKPLLIANLLEGCGR